MAWNVNNCIIKIEFFNMNYQGVEKMNYCEDRVNDIKIAYIGGGSQLWAKSLMNDLALEARISGTVALYDINFEAALTNEKVGNILSNKKETKGKWQYKAVKTIEETLKDADFVVISITPGTLKEMASDVHVPEKYGIYQSVGDTVGPGGIVRALRAVPMYAQIAEYIKKYSPNAWVLSYTNPMSVCTRTLFEIFPEIKAFGCCHEVFHVQKLLTQMLEDMEGIKDIKRKEIKINVIGINHFTWISEASYQGKDLMPLYESFADKYYEAGFEPYKDFWKSSSFESAHRVKFDLFKQYGLIAAAGDRHLAEFMPPNYLRDKETIASWKMQLTSVDSRMKTLKEKISDTKKIIAGEKDIEVKSSGEEGVEIILALLGLKDTVSNVNIPNKGQIGNLPLGSIVETNALIQRNSIRPVYAGKLPLDILNIVQRHAINQESIVKAALTKDKKLAFNTFVNEPLVSISRSQAEKLFAEMLNNTNKYLKEWDLS